MVCKVKDTWLQADVTSWSDSCAQAWNQHSDHALLGLGPLLCPPRTPSRIRAEPDHSQHTAFCLGDIPVLLFYHFPCPPAPHQLCSTRAPDHSCPCHPLQCAVSCLLYLIKVHESSHGFCCVPIRGSQVIVIIVHIGVCPEPAGLE